MSSTINFVVMLAVLSTITMASALKCSFKEPTKDPVEMACPAKAEICLKTTCAGVEIRTCSMEGACKLKPECQPCTECKSDMCNGDGGDGPSGGGGTGPDNGGGSGPPSGGGGAVPNPNKGSGSGSGSGGNEASSAGGTNMSATMTLALGIGGMLLGMVFKQHTM